MSKEFGLSRGEGEGMRLMNFSLFEDRNLSSLLSFFFCHIIVLSFVDLGQWRDYISSSYLDTFFYFIDFVCLFFIYNINDLNFLLLEQLFNDYLSIILHIDRANIFI